MRFNTLEATTLATREGGKAVPVNAWQALRRSVLTCLLGENTFYENGISIIDRIRELVPLVEPQRVASLAVEARNKMYLRHVPLLLVRELARKKGNGSLVADTLADVIQRPDEIAEFLAIYWKDIPKEIGKRQSPISNGVRRGLARAFLKFNRFQFAKWNRRGKITLSDAMALVRPKSTSAEQAVTFSLLRRGELETPDTWETALSAGKDKRETFERLLRENRLGGMALLMNLRNMVNAQVDTNLIRERLEKGVERMFPYRFVVAAKMAPTLEDSIEKAMLLSVNDIPWLHGTTGILVDVSGSMNSPLSSKRPHEGTTADPTTRKDVAAGLAILLREKCEKISSISTFSADLRVVPPCRGFALRDAICASQPPSSTYLRKALETLKQVGIIMDRLVVITDEQSHDGILPAWTRWAYVINVSAEKNGVGYRNGWTHIDGWSDRVFDYIRETELEGLGYAQ